jgi:multiple sugar transport system ATP-binding protein
MASIRLDRVDKRYPNGYVAARELSLDVADGELLVLVGPSGSGKSTVLRMIAGLESPTGGRLFIGDRDVTRLPPQERDIAMVFQSYALYPHMTVRENLSFGLRLRKQAPAVIAQRVRDVAESIGLSALLDRKPAQLSGGQRQRVALGRAIVREPQAFLFDEPLSNLDAQLRVETRAELARLHRRLGATMVYVTHDQVEAMTLGTRVAVLKEGVLQQVAPPMELYRRPANQFVGAFIGSPAMNFVSGQLDHARGGSIFSSAAVTMEVPCDGAAGGEVVLGIRPQDVTFAGRDARDASESGALRGTVSLVEPLGSEQIVYLSIGAQNLVAIAPPDLSLHVDEVVPLRIPSSAVHLFDARSGARLPSPS